MSEHDKNQRNEEPMSTEENQNHQQTTQQPPQDPQATTSAATDEMAAQQEQLARRDERIADLEAALKVALKNEQEAQIRARAEIDNDRRRVEVDIDKARKFALEKFSTELLPVIDNLERALSVADKNNNELTAIIEGIELTLKSFLDTIKKFGVEPVEEVNVPFNPDVHQAMSMIESADHDANQVINVVQKGYLLNGRLIRPAMVIVSK